jgi:hypothetical protein
MATYRIKPLVWETGRRGFDPTTLTAKTPMGILWVHADEWGRAQECEDFDRPCKSVEDGQAQASAWYHEELAKWLIEEPTEEQALVRQLELMKKWDAENKADTALHGPLVHGEEAMWGCEQCGYDGVLSVCPPVDGQKKIEFACPECEGTYTWKDDRHDRSA